MSHLANVSWRDLAAMAVALPLGQWTTALALLLALVVAYFGIRQRYFLIWLSGWLSLLAARAVTEAHSFPVSAATISLIRNLGLAAAVTSFALAAFWYTGERRKLAWVWAPGALCIAAAVVHAYRPAAPSLIFFEIAYLAIIGIASARLCFFALGRRRAGAWFFVAALLMLSPELQGSSDEYQFVSALLLRASIVVLLLEESRARACHIEVMSAITTAAVGSHEPGSVMQLALHELSRLYGAQFAWFQRIEGEELVLEQFLGSPELAQGVRFPLSGSGAVALARNPVTTAVRVDRLPPRPREKLMPLGVKSVMVAPMMGKESMVGMLGFGFTRSREFTPEELRFLTATARQLGMARENLTLFELVANSQRQWLTTIDSIDDYILVHDDQPKVLRLNQALARRLGRPLRELTGQPLASVLPNAAEGCPYCLFARESGAELSDPCFGGFSLVSTSSYTPEHGERLGTVHVICDRSARRAVEERYRMLFESVHEGVFVTTSEGKLIDCNPAFAEMLGYASREELLGVDLAEELIPEPDQRAAYHRDMAENDYLSNYEITLRRKDGRVITLMENSFATRGKDGKVERHQGLVMDITEKKRAEDEMRRRNHELGALNAMANIATRTFDIDEILRNTLFWTSELFGQNCDIILFDPVTHKVERCESSRHRDDPVRHELRGLVEDGLVEIVTGVEDESLTERDLHRAPEPARRWFAGHECSSIICVVLYSQRKAMGFLLISGSLPGQFTETDRNLAIAIGRQLGNSMEKILLYEETVKAYANLRDTQEQLLQSEKMSAVGQLVSGVAHELNNPLTAILGYTQLLESEPMGERAQDFVSKLYRQAQRTHRVVQNLLSFSRQRKPIQSQVDLRRVLEDTLSLRDFDMKLHHIVLERDYQPAMPFITGDPHQLEQVFLNIVNNAVDALMDSSQEGKLRVRIFAEGKRACVEFRDTGPGIKEPSKVFDPFYTTKKLGKGTGLGLSICYGIAKEHGGDIVAFNHEQGGAVFQLWLPIGRSLHPMNEVAAPVASTESD
jgi:two-component system NtrC family sensor kinase